MYARLLRKIAQVPHALLEAASDPVRVASDRILYQRLRNFTMVPPAKFHLNLELCRKFQEISGCVVECGVWRGGMSAGMATILGKDRNYYLFDSFEGLPPAEAIDGESAIRWQEDKESKNYLDNCKAEESFALQCMSRTGVNFKTIKGWFNESFKSFEITEPVAILRLDADWYSSTMECLDFWYSRVATGGVIILDDYYLWDGCSKATHDFLSKGKLSERVNQWRDSEIYYIVKK